MCVYYIFLHIFILIITNESATFEGKHQTSDRPVCYAVEKVDVCEPTVRRTTRPRSGVVHHLHTDDAGDQSRGQKE